MAGNINTLMAVSVDVVGATNNDYTVTRGLEIIDVYAHGNAGTANTVTPQTNVSGAGLTNCLSAVGALVATITPVANQIIYGGGLVDAQATLTATDTIRMVGGAAGTTARVFVKVIPTSWIAG